MDEITLVREAQQGNVESFNTLVLHYQTAVFNLAYRLIGDSATAADAAQEAFISAYNHLPQFRGGSFKSWLMRIVTNSCYDEMRRRKRRPSVSLDDPDSDSLERLISPQEGPETVSQQRALSQAIQDCLDGLPEEQRLATVLCDIQGYDYQEISLIVRVSLGTIKSRISRARQRLRDCLQDAAELLPDAYRLNKEN